MKKRKPIAIPLVIDSREPKGVKEAFYNSGLFENIHVRELDVGDFKIGGLRIERKGFSDFVSSWREGRLASQVERMMALEGEVGIVIVHDYEKFSKYIDYGLKAAAMKHMENMNFVLPVFKTKNFDSFLLKVYKFAKHAEDGEYLFHFSGRKTKIKKAENRIIYFYASLPGINEILAKRIWEKYPLPTDLFKAISKCGILQAYKGKKNIKKWYEDIRGVGKGKAIEIEEMILQGKLE